MKAIIGQQSPLLSVSEWVQGEPVNLNQLLGKVVLIEVFQVNCPGCFLYSLPQAVNLYRKYAEQGLSVLGIATAFEDFDKNTLANLTALIEEGKVIGETARLLTEQGQLTENRLSFRIPFPVAMDRLNKRQKEVTQQDISDFIDEQIPNFQQLPESHQQKIQQQAKHYLESLDYQAETFITFNLKGTPSHILIDKQGILRNCAFGACPDLEMQIIELLKQT